MLNELNIREIVSRHCRMALTLLRIVVGEQGTEETGGEDAKFGETA
jgi:hypothetical protein